MRQVLTLMMLSACTGQYDVRVSFVDPAVRDQAVRIQVAVVPECFPQRLGAAPSEALRTVEFATDEGALALGDVEPGDYGLYARAMNSDCEVIAAGCTPILLTGGGDAGLSVELSPLDPVQPFCDAQSTCVAGRCASRDGSASDANGSDAGDAGTDAPIPPDIGVADANPPDTLDANMPDAGPDVLSCTPPGLLAHWPISTETFQDGEMLDVSGNEFHAIVDPVLVVRNVGERQVLDYGAPAYGRATVPSMPLDMGTGGATTVSMWFFRDGASVDDTLINAPISPDRYDLWLTTDGDQTLLCFNTESGDCWGIADIGLLGRWVHVVAVFANGPVDASRLYIDGTAVAASCLLGSCGTPRTVRNTVVIGGSPSYAWKGMFDDIQMYDRALTADEVAQLYACAP